MCHLQVKSEIQSIEDKISHIEAMMAGQYFLLMTFYQNLKPRYALDCDNDMLLWNRWDISKENLTNAMHA